MSLFVLFISLLIVAQHVSGNHVPIIRSWRLRDVIALFWYVPWLHEGGQVRLVVSASMDGFVWRTQPWTHYRTDMNGNVTYTVNRPLVSANCCYLSPAVHNTDVCWYFNFPSLVLCSTSPRRRASSYFNVQCHNVARLHRQGVNYGYARVLRYCRNGCVAFEQVLFCEWVVLWVPGAVQWAAFTARTVWLSSAAAVGT